MACSLMKTMHAVEAITHVILIENQAQKFNMTSDLTIKQLVNIFILSFLLARKFLIVIRNI